MRTSGTAPRPGADRRARLLRLLALPVLPLLVLASALTAPTGAVAASSKYGNARYHQWSFVTSHNAYTDDTQWPVPPNQSQSIKDQLEGGVRGLMLDTYDSRGTGPVQMCHGSSPEVRVCYDDFKAGLLTVVNFLQKNPQEVVTIFLENYASQQTLSKAITDLLDAKGAGKMLFNQNDWGIFSSNWPRLKDMVSANQRLVIFQDSWTDDQAVGSGTLMYTWTHTVENEYDYGLGQPSGCKPRGKSMSLDQNPVPNIKLTPLFTMNQFSSKSPDPKGAAKINNGAQLKSRIEKSCRPAAGGRNPNFVAVDHYQLSDNSGLTPVSVVDELNRDSYVFEPDPAVWTVNDSKQYVSTYGTNRCMVRGDEFSDGSGGLVTQRACANPAPSSHQWTATKPNYDGKGYYWIKAGNGSCLTVPYNNGTPPGDGTQLYWWPCETRWFSGSQLWNVMPTNTDSNGQSHGYYFINQWTGRCLTLDPGTSTAKAGKVTQAACPKR